METKQCPSCGSSIQGSSKFCPECGYRFDPPSDETPPETALVEDAPLEEPPTDGGLSLVSPHSSVSQSSRPLNKKLIIALCAVAVVVCAIVAVVAVRNNQMKAAAEYRASYITNLQSAKISMLTAAADSEEIANLTLAVWHDTIYQEIDYDTYLYTVRPSKLRTSGDFYKNYIYYSLNEEEVMYDDFNDSLNALFSSEEIKAKVSALSDAQNSMANLMTELQNPPDDLELCYKTVTDMYSSFVQLSNLAINPTGSYNSYSESFGNHDTDFMKFYNQLDVQIPTE